MVSWTRLSVTLDVHFLSCIFSLSLFADSLLWSCIYFSFTLTDDGRSSFQDNIASCRSSHKTGERGSYFVRFLRLQRYPPPLFHEPADVAVPIIGKLATGYTRLDLCNWATQWKKVVLLAWALREMKCILHTIASICEYMTDVELHDISVYCIDVCSKTSILWTSFGDMDIVFPFFQPCNKKWPWSFSCVWGKSWSLRDSVQWRTRAEFFWLWIACHLWMSLCTFKFICGTFNDAVSIRAYITSTHLMTIMESSTLIY